METSGPNVKLWLPCLLLAHAIALLCIFSTNLLQLTGKKGWRLKKSSGERDVGCSDTEDASTDGAAAVDPLPVVGSPVKAKHLSHDGMPSSHALLMQTLSDPTPLTPRYTDGPEGLQACVSQRLATDALTLEWRGIGCSYNVNGATKVVLQDIWGRAYPGQMQALMGPSGAGKSTLMDILAMRKSLGNLTGGLLVNGSPAHASFIRQTSYVPQEDTFIPTMTCKETLAFYGGVSLGGKEWPRAKRIERVEEVLAAVGLAHTVNTLVGGVLPGGLHLRGLSGGERRRLGIAAGILGAPSVLFLDEPTSGLDSFAALSVMGHLQHVAQATHQTVIATIHQPRQAIWEMFDTVSLLASGRLMYHGGCAQMMPWFQSIGYAYTRGSEPDWVLDLVATGFNKPENLFGHTMQSKDDLDAAADAFKDGYTRDVVGFDPSSNGKDDQRSSSRGIMARLGEVLVKPVASSSSDSDTDSPGPGPAPAAVKSGMTAIVASSVKGSLRDFQSSITYSTSWSRQFTALLSREVKSMTRNPFDVAARIFTFTYVALLFGLMGYNVELEGLDGFNSINNMLFTTVLIMLLMPYVGISLYTADKTMYIADASAKRYRASAYYIAKVLGNLPFNILVAVLYSGIFYGMCGLRRGPQYFGKFATIVTLLQIIAAQVLHLCAVVAPNHDTTFSMSIVWTAVQLLCSSFFLNFSQVYMQWITQLRYISAAYFSLEALVQNEFNGRINDCSSGLESGLVDMLQAGLMTATPMQKMVLNRLKDPQPGCLFKQDALVAPLGFTRPFGVSVGVLLGYLGVLHVLTFLGLLMATRNERR